MKKMSNLSIVNTDYIEKKLRELENPDSDKPKKRRSRLDENIPDEIKIKLYQISSDFTISDDNVKADMISEVMESIGFKEIGTGTNRIAFMKDGYVYKVALDDRGFIDNISEYKRSIEHPEYFVKVYETNRTILVCEYCELLSEEDFHIRRQEIKDILTYLSQFYVMDDVGLTTKNYCNWGLRRSDKEGEPDKLIIIDNAYFYPIRNNWKMITCGCGGKIVPNTQFTGYMCSNTACCMTYTVDELLNKANFDYDRADTEVVKVVNRDGDESSNEYIKVTGNNFGATEEVKMEESEAEKLMEKYQQTSEEDSYPNAVDAFDLFDEDEDKSSDSEINKYKALNLSAFRKDNE